VVANNAKFNGVNLLDNSTGTGGYKALANTSGTTIQVAGENLSLGGANVTVTATMSIGTSTLAGTALAAVNASIDKVSASLARLGTGFEVVRHAPELRRQAARHHRSRCR
jgi:flagellin